MPNTTAPAETKVKLGTPTVSFDGQTFTIPQLIETVRSLMAKNVTRAAEPLTRQEWKDAELRQAEQLGKLDAIASDIRDISTTLAQMSGDVTFLGERAIQSAPIFLRLSEFLDRSSQMGYRASELTQPGLFGHTTGGASLAGSDTRFGNGPVDISLQHASPSVDGGSNPTVGDGQVAGVETAAPAPNAGVDLVLISLADQLRAALQIESEAKRRHRSDRMASQVSSKILEDAQRAVEAAQSEIRKHVVGGAA